MSGDGSVGGTMSTSNEKSRMMAGERSFASTALGTKPTPAAKWNTESLGLRLSLDAVSAMGSAAIICPAITIIDKAIIEKAAKGLPIRQSIASSFRTLVTRPHMFLTSTPFLLIYMLYSSTYVTANLIDTITSTIKDRPFDAVSAGPAKFLATSAVNISLCVFKDSRFARIFGAQANNTSSTQPSSTKRTGGSSQCHPSSNSKGPPIPKTALGLFALRDSLTIFASFNLPTLLSPHIPDILASTPSSKTALAQFSIPASVQLLSTPIHLLGLDLYNRQPPGGLPASDRYLRVKRDYLPSCFARIGRIVPAYGVGGVVNTKFRTKLMESLQRE